MLNWFFMYRNYREKCKEVQFLTKLIDINTNVFKDVLRMSQKEKQNDQTN